MFALSQFSVNKNHTLFTHAKLTQRPRPYLSSSFCFYMSYTPRVAIATDSAASLPPGFATQPGVFIVPMTVTLEGQSYRDGIDITATEFYRRLRSASSSPTTSAPSPAAYLDTFRCAAERFNSVLCITAGERFSSSFDSASAAAEDARLQFPDAEVRILDSQAAAGSQALAALEAWRAAQQGATLARAKMNAIRVIERVSLLAFVDTLRYLRRSGRVPLAAHIGASLMMIKPLFRLRHSEITTVARPRTRRTAIRRMLELIRDEVGTGALHVAVMHADAIEDAESIRDSIARDYDCAELYISEFTPAMGAHIGPGLLGIAYWSESA